VQRWTQMTIPPTFAPPAGLGFSVHKKPLFSTIVAQHVSGREVRDALYAAPIWQFEVPINGLSSNSSYPGLGNTSLQTLMGFFLSLQGQFGTFLYTDPTDFSVTGGSLINPATGGTTGDGATTVFQFVRYLGGSGFYEPIGSVTTALAPGTTTNVYLNGVSQPFGSPADNWAVTTPTNGVCPNQLTFASPPGSGVQ